MDSNCVILHVEDDDNDSFAFQRALKRIAFPGLYRRVRNIGDAQDYLRRQGRFESSAEFPDPTIIVTDMALANDGTAAELAAWIRADALRADLRVVVLTGVAELQTQHAAIEAGADAVFLKRPLFEDLVLKVREILRYCDPDDKTG